MKKKEQFSIALWDRLKKDNIPHTFETRSGIKIEHVTHFDYNIKQPIVGYDTNDNSIEQWEFNGNFEIDGSKSELDLFIVWEEEQLKDSVFKAYMAIMPYEGAAMTFSTLELAQNIVGATAIAIIPISIPYTKGEGLNNPKSN